MKALELTIDFRRFKGTHILIGKSLTAVAGNNGTGKSTILGLLANSSQFPKCKTLLGKPYRGEFSELFKASAGDDPSGQHIGLKYADHGNIKNVTFRTGWQQKGERFRIIPKRETEDGKTTEAKIESPIIYLGLSRLYPVGEVRTSIETRGQRWANPEEQEWFVSNYSRILSMYDDIKSVSNLSITGLSQKRGTGVQTESYGPTANSAGQDNLGQILMSVLSFKRLAGEMGTEWDGGLLLIDEIDASLHPAAQLRLIKLLLDESRNVSFQVVFTTHSTTVLKELSSKNQHNAADSAGDVEVAYLTDANEALEAKRNPSWMTMENDLLVTNSAIATRKVGVFSEDAEARWFIKELLTAKRPDLLRKIDLIEAALGCDQMIALYKSDFSYFRDHVVVFDGDVSENQLKKIPPSLRKNGSNILNLPGTVRPESVIWDFLSSTHPEDDNGLWQSLDRAGVSRRSLIEIGPDSEHYSGEGSERNRYKSWFHDYEGIFSDTHVIEHWIQNNQASADDFLKKFINAYNSVAGRTTSEMVPVELGSDQD